MLVQELPFLYAQNRELVSDSWEWWSLRQHPTNSCPTHLVQLIKVSQLLMWCLKFRVTWENTPEHHSLCPEDPGQLPISALVHTQGQAVALRPGLLVRVPRAKMM